MTEKLSINEQLALEMAAYYESTGSTTPEIFAQAVRAISLMSEDSAQTSQSDPTVDSSNLNKE